MKRIAIPAIVMALIASSAAFAAAPSRGTVVKLQKTAKYGKVLATEKGLTLYLTTHDRKNKSRCGSTCIVYWPPLLTIGKPVAGPGVRKSLLRRVRRKDGTWQVTYNGHPLYRFANDRTPGEAGGEGINLHWYVVGANGKKK